MEMVVGEEMAVGEDGGTGSHCRVAKGHERLTHVDVAAAASPTVRSGCGLHFVLNQYVLCD